jgi:hypothetical protein
VKYACQYTIIQFLPFVETGEFANIGIAVACPEAGYFGFEVAPKGWRRISDFFVPLERRIYSAAIDRLNTHLDKLATMENGGASAEDITVLWAELTRSRDGMIRYSPPRAILTEDPEQVLEDLFGRYVERNFATTYHHERPLEQAVRKVLANADVGKLFKSLQLGEPYYHIQLPFVQTAGERVVKVIKPLFLAHDEPIKILNHGGEWLERLRRLRKHQVIPFDVLIPVASPGTQDLRDKACREICDDLLNEKFQVGSIEDSAQITAFAQGERSAA